MTRKIRESKARLNKEHATLLEAFQTIYDSGFVKFAVSILVAAGLLVWRVEVMSMKMSDVSTMVKHHDDSLKTHTFGVWHRLPRVDTLYALTTPAVTRQQLTDRERQLENYYDQK
jgi:hypothetical protein